MKKQRLNRNSLRLHNPEYSGSRIKSGSQTNNHAHFNYFRESSLSKLANRVPQGLSRSNSVVLENKKNQMMDQLSKQLKSIKQTIAAINTQRKGKDCKREKRVITEISKYPEHYTKDILSQIEEIKKKKRKSPKKQMNNYGSPDIYEKTLFYGMEVIDGFKFKIKIKLTPTKYILLAKNNLLKMAFQLDHYEYMRIHQQELKGNPCHIFKLLAIEGHRLKLQLGESCKIGSMKSNVTYQ